MTAWIQKSQQSWPYRRQLAQMRRRKLVQHRVRRRGRRHLHPPVIRRVQQPRDKPQFGQPVHQFHRAVRANQQMRRDLADAQRLPSRHALDCQQGLMLLRRHSRSAWRNVAGNGEAGARDAGRLRIEGRDYVVRDGDVLLFRFNV